MGPCLTAFRPQDNGSNLTMVSLLRRWFFFMLSAWVDYPMVWCLWKIPENHMTGQPKPSEWNWVGRTTWELSMIVLPWNPKSLWPRAWACWFCSDYGSQQIIHSFRNSGVSWTLLTQGGGICSCSLVEYERPAIIINDLQM